MKQAITPPTQPNMSARQLSLLFLAFGVLHFVVVYLANMFFPAQVVLGNNIVSPLMALFYTVLPFTLLAVGAVPVIEYAGEIMKRSLSTMEWMIAYLVLNTVVFWGLARVAEWLGMGLASWMVALVLGAIVTFLQDMVVGMIMPKK